VAFSPDGTRLATSDLYGVVKVWDARPMTRDDGEVREALGLLEFLFAKPLCQADIIALLRRSATIRPRARELALSLAQSYHEEKAPEPYHKASWAVVRRPYLNVFQYGVALLQAEQACRLLPDKGKYVTILGAAYYRAGRYREAIETLGRADRLDKGSPAALAFLAMAHHQFGQREQARAGLARLRELLDQPRWAKDAETLDLMHEVQEFIAPPAATTER
jgi:tetratricopeptide (TPR) repeat protein